MRPSFWLGQVRGTRRRLGTDVLESALVHRPAMAPRQTNTGPLSGWPISIKDNFCTLDMPTSCSSKMLSEYQSPFEATAVTLLRQAGGAIVAKTNCDEFGMGSANLHSAYGPALNPQSWLGEERVAGGSSGGAAASVACKVARIALASDTGGSIRTPAAYCGVYGLKPSYGLISRWGLVAYADSLDTVGLLGSNARDVNTAFRVLSHFDEQDPTSIAVEIRDEARMQTERASDAFNDGVKPLDGLRVGVPMESFPSELNQEMLPALRETLGRLKRLGAEIRSVGIPSSRYALSAYYVLASAEASSNLARYDGIRYGHRTVSTHLNPTSTPFHAHISKTRSEGFGLEVQKRILLGTYSLTSDLFDNYFLQAQKVRRLIQTDFDASFRLANVLRTNEQRSNPSAEGVDILVTPSAVDVAPTLEKASQLGIEAYTQDFLTVPASLAGIPALTIPAGHSRDMPVGVTLTTQWGFDDFLFKVADCLATE